MSIVVFWEADFPFIDTPPLARERLPEALGQGVQFVSAADLAAALAKGADLVIFPYGSAFPKAAWPALMRYLRGGGHFLNLGGAPFTRPVRREGGTWRAELPQTAYGREVMIRHTWPIDIPPEAMPDFPAPEAAWRAALGEYRPRRSWALQVKLTETALYPEEIGSQGPMTSTIKPLLRAILPASAATNGAVAKHAAPVVGIDHFSGPFAGGRWVFAACEADSPLPTAFIAQLCQHASRPLLRLRVAPAYAAYRGGEKAAIALRVHAANPMELTVRVTVTGEDGNGIYGLNYQVDCGESETTVNVPALALPRPGLYRIAAVAHPRNEMKVVLGTARNAVWQTDETFLRSASPLSVNEDYFLRDGKPYPITGTTYMSTTTHRLFLVEPDAQSWDADMAAMKSAGVNIIRTGIWMGWKRISGDDGSVDEAALRALEAFLLCARRHDLPVIFTFFAFLPERWAGVNSYLDPVALAAQANFLAGFARRFAGVNHLLWDLINEPSVAPPTQLWSCRPSYDTFEAAAWQKWLAEQEISEDEWRERWRLTPGDALDLPPAADFADSHHLDSKHPVRAYDFGRFAQDVFTQWTRRMVNILRENGNANQLITVGQDEGGTGRSPSPWFHGEAVDFTSNHSWWQNDDLLWDSVISKTPNRPNLLEETGVMFVETPDGRPGRSLEQIRDLLERKMALAFAGGCAGFIQWLWNTNHYNNSDNEAGIGFLRADGSEKPELQAFREVARFFAANAERMVGRVRERVCIVIPHANILSVRDTADAATRRAVRTMEYRLGVACRAISEFRAGEMGEVDLIVLPSPRVLTRPCWEALLGKVESGATLLVSGFVEADEYWRPVERLARFGLRSVPRTVLHEESMTSANGALLRATFATVQMGILPRFEKAAAADGAPLPLTQLGHGRGKIVYCPLPIEHAMAEEQTEAVYRVAAEAAVIALPRPVAAGVLMREVRFEQATLHLIVSESAADEEVAVGSARITVPAGRIALAFVDAHGNPLSQYASGAALSAR